MARIWKIANLTVLGFLILICGLGLLYKHISFGMGLGDIFGYFILYAGTLLHLILTLVFRKKGHLSHIILTFLFLIFSILVVLNATIWRGSEYRWNGELFYTPCSTKILIENQNVQKEKLISMCSMEYYSTFSGSWDGQFVILDGGEVKVPEKLEKFVRRPITKVEIEPAFNPNFNTTAPERKIEFRKDTLQISREYQFSGEICGIRDGVPVIMARIK